MLLDFVTDNRDEILAQARIRVALRGTPASAATVHGLPTFLDQLSEALRKAEFNEVLDHAEIEHSASHHGDDLFEQGLTVAQVVNSYGDLCQVITKLAVDQHVTIGAYEFQTLNLCLDDAVAGAVTAYTTRREKAIYDEGHERLGVLAHELRNALNGAMLAFGSIKKGTVAPAGSTGAMVDRSHMRLESLIDRSLTGVRLGVGVVNLERVAVWEILEEAEIGGTLIAQGRGLQLTVAIADASLVVSADRPILLAAVSNLLQNAFKFTRPATTVQLRATATADRVLIDVEDECGGLPPGPPEGLLQPFVQKGRDRSGLGLGLSICVKAAKLMGGEMHVKDLPGKGCIFTIDLPRQPPPPTPIRSPHRDGAENKPGSQAPGGAVGPQARSKRG